jgi:hypothetical protein
MLVRYRWINHKGVLERPWTKLRVLKAISSTLKFQFTIKCWKVDFLMSSKTRSCESSREKFRMVRALLPDTPKPPQFQPELPFFSFLQYFQFFPCLPRFTNKCLAFVCLRPPSPPHPTPPHPPHPPVLFSTVRYCSVLFSIVENVQYVQYVRYVRHVQYVQHVH